MQICTLLNIKEKIMRKIKVNSIYKHFKGNLYLVEDLAVDS